MGDLWLCLAEDESKEVRSWKGTLGFDEDSADYKFRIEWKDNKFIFSGGRDFEWKLAINKQNFTVGFVKEETSTFSTDFKLVMDQSFGEDAFQLNCAWSDERGNKSVHQLKLTDVFSDNPRIALLNKSRELSKKKGAGLTIGQIYHTFIMAKKW